MANHQKDRSAEEKIKAAARTIFTTKGYAAARTRDIAAMAGVNLALLNYYFRSKKRLFDIVMLEEVLAFKNTMVATLNDESTMLDQKVEKLVSNYIDVFSQRPELPLFFLSELRNSQRDMLGKVKPFEAIFDSSFYRQLTQTLGTSQAARLHPLHVIMNLAGMAVFPFIISPIVRQHGQISPEEFDAIVQQRKKLIPIWIRAMMTAT